MYERSCLYTSQQRVQWSFLAYFTEDKSTGQKGLSCALSTATDHGKCDFPKTRSFHSASTTDQYSEGAKYSNTEKRLHYPAEAIQMFDNKLPQL